MLLVVLQHPPSNFKVSHFVRTQQHPAGRLRPLRRMDLRVSTTHIVISSMPHSLTHLLMYLGRGMVSSPKRTSISAVRAI